MIHSRRHGFSVSVLHQFAVQATCSGEYIWSEFKKMISPHDFLSLWELCVWGVKPLSLLPGTKYKTVTLLKCCKRPHKPTNPSFQRGIWLSCALGLKSSFRPLPPRLGDWQVVPWKELLYSGNIDLMMINTPCFPQRESKSTCWLPETLILSLEYFSCGVESLLETSKKGSLCWPP